MTHPAQIRQKNINLRFKGYTLNQISQKLNLPKSTVFYWISNLSLPSKTKTILKIKKKKAGFKKNNTIWQKAHHSSRFISWTPAKLKQLKTLYYSGLSMKQVAQKLNCSLSSVNHAMRRYQIKRRTAAHTQKIKFYQSPLSFNPKKKLNTKEKQLKTAGLMLYWAEGSKKIPDKVDFANSDPLMVRVFVQFLRKIYRVNENRLRCLIYCYPTHNIQILTSFWSNITAIPKSQFVKPYIRKDGGNIRDKMKYGVLHVAYSDKRLLQLIIKEIRHLSYNI